MNNCPHDFGSVLDTRKRGDYVYRRRTCTRCGNNFTTMEMDVGDDIINGYAVGTLASQIRKLSTENRHLMTQLVDRLTNSN
jgi:transcriptional regulator NrdR family protein